VAPEQQPAGTEIVVAVVTALGARIDDVVGPIRESMRAARFEVEEIRISELIHEQFGGDRLRENAAGMAKAMDHGNQLREQRRLGWAAAGLAIKRIRVLREQDPRLRRCYVLRSLKHPHELEKLREIYRDRFFAVGVFTPKEERTHRIAQRIADAEGGRPAQYFTAAQDLIERDQWESGREFGQLVREAFPAADFFVSTNDQTESQVRRWVDILFRRPVVTPTREELGMFHAFAASLQSAALGRQVGASITVEDGDLVAAGCNEVARSGGGQYWSGDDGDRRDFQIGFDQSHSGKLNALREVVKQVEPNLTDERFNAIRLALKDSAVMNLTEFTRDVHAETSALLSAAKRGVAVRGATLYATAFPCHGCAKHIVAAGIRRVVYIEPYPKSYVAEFYADSIALDGDNEVGRVPFVSFTGVAPRHFAAAFQARGKRRSGDGRTPTWVRGDGPSLFPSGPPDQGILELERDAIAELESEQSPVQQSIAGNETSAPSDKVAS
jgi:cytidine deaminase